MNAIAVVSMLHQGIAPASARRLFRGRQVLEWTVKRLLGCRMLKGVKVVGWEDQVAELRGFLGEAVILAGPRRNVPRMEAISAARRWADGWRGGLLSASCYDQGFDGAAVMQAMGNAEGAVLVDPEAGLVDPGLIDGLVEHARERGEIGYAFVQAAPGLGGILLKREALEEMERRRMHPGQLLGYLPDVPGRDPIGNPECAPAPTAVARSAESFLMDSERRIARLERGTESLNGQLIQTGAEELVARMGGGENDWPREVVLEMTTRRLSRPIFGVNGIERADLTMELAERLFGELPEDVRVTFAGAGDALLHPQWERIVAAAGGRGVHVETDLLGEGMERVAEAGVDVVSVNLPGASPEMYERMMGVDGIGSVLGNLKRLVERRLKLGKGVPLVVPTFVKCRENWQEMEAWYDHWLKTLGCAVITGASDFGGLIEDVAAADMSPPRRIGCRRIATRMMVLSDGRVVSCEQDVMGRQVMGVIGQRSVKEIWENGFGGMQRKHGCAHWGEYPVCVKCKEWHRP